MCVDHTPQRITIICCLHGLLLPLSSSRSFPILARRAGGSGRAGGDRHGCQERQCCNGDFGKAACSRAGGPDSRQRGRRTKKRSYITRPFLRVLRGPSKSSYFRGEFLKHRGWHRHAVRMAMMSVKFRREGVDSRRNWANS